MVRYNRTPSNGRGGLGRIQTDFVKFLKKARSQSGQIFIFFKNSQVPLSGQKSFFSINPGSHDPDKFHWAQGSEPMTLWFKPQM